MRNASCHCVYAFYMYFCTCWLYHDVCVSSIVPISETGIKVQTRPSSDIAWMCIHVCRKQLIYSSIIIIEFAYIQFNCLSYDIYKIKHPLAGVAYTCVYCHLQILSCGYCWDTFPSTVAISKIKHTSNGYTHTYIHTCTWCVVTAGETDELVTMSE